jgi:flagellar motor switch protein FliG
LKRLDQIQIQVNGIASFKRQDVQKKLNLTDEQKAEIRKIGEGLKEDAAEVLKDASSAPLRKIPGAIVKVKELKNTATQKAIDKLTSAQQQTWQEMIGEKFDFKLELLNRQGVRP